jgi:hypothetical protein
MDSKELNITCEKDFSAGMKGFYYGFEKKLTRYAVQKGDTRIGA